MSNSENISPCGIARIRKEIAELMTNAPDDIELHVNEENYTDIQCTITGPVDTPFESGQFRVRLALGHDYPTSPPKGFFMTKIFHPNVAPSTGEICVNTLKKDWTSDLGIRHILVTVRCLLIAPNPESALNEEAGRLILEDYKSYFTRAKMHSEIYAGAKKTSTNTQHDNTNKAEEKAQLLANQKAKERSKKLLKRL